MAQVKSAIPATEITNNKRSLPTMQDQLATLKSRSLETMNLGPPLWAARPPCLEGPLRAEELKAFFENGYLIKHNVFTRDELKPVVNAIEAQVESIANRLKEVGLIKDTCANEGFYQRMHALEKQYPGASVLLHKKGDLPPAFQNLWQDARLLDMAQQLLGGSNVDVAGHPVWNLRVKVPGSEAAVVPWHQDAAYLDPVCAHTLQVTAWIPLLDAKAENGCLQVMKGGHRSGKTAKHSCCAGGTWYVEMDIEDASKRLGVDCKDEAQWVICEIPMGSVLLLNNLIPHRSLSNVSKDTLWSLDLPCLSNISKDTRWSLDLRWQDASLPVGFWGIKEPILMRKAGQPDWLIPWNEFVAVDRSSAQSHAAHDAALKDENKGEETSAAATAAEDEFEPVIAGPWMLRWDLVHHNAHTTLFEKQAKANAAAGEGSSSTAGWHKA